MRSIERTVIPAIGSACLVASAVTAEMTGAQLKELVSGKSVYLETVATSTGGAGQGVIYYAPDGTALYKTAKGPILHGTWTIKENTVCINWKEQPNIAAGVALAIIAVVYQIGPKLIPTFQAVSDNLK